MKKNQIKESNLENIRGTFIELGGNKCILGNKLLDEAIFCNKTLENLKKQIEMEGTTNEMCQGSYSITRESPALKSYNTLIKNYQSLIKQITDLLKEEVQQNIQVKDELEEFILK